MGNKKKVVHIISNLGQGGAQILLYDILTNLKLYDDLELSVISIDSGEYIKRFLDAGIKVIDLKETGLLNAKIYFKLKKVLKEIAPDIVHTHLNKADFYGRLAAKSVNSKVIISTCHNYSTNHKGADIEKKNITDRIDNFVTFRTSSSVIAISDIVFRYLIMRDIKFGKITEVIHNGIKTSMENYVQTKDLIKKKRKEFGIGEEDFVIGLIGRFDKQKGHLFLLKSLKGLIHKNENIKIIFVGDGILKEEITRFINENSLKSNVVITGFLPNAEPLIEICDVVCVPSLWEGFGLIALEAMIKGKIVVASETGGLKEIIVNRVNGYLFEPLNENQFLSLIEYIYKNFDSLSNIRSNAIATVKNNFDISVTSKKYYEFYQKQLLAKVLP